MENEIKLYTVDEIVEILKSKEKLVYVDDGLEEVLVRFKDLPDFIVDYNLKFGSKDLTVYEYPAKSMTPMLTTFGYFLNKCEPEVREKIINRLVALQTGEEEIRDYKVIDEYLFEDAHDKIKQEQNKLKKEKNEQER